MTLDIAFIQHLFPQKKIYHRLDELFSDQPDVDQNTDYIHLSIERNEQCRQFFSTSIDELSHLFAESTHLQRPLYEVVRSTRRVKPYLDFEYNTTSNPDLLDPSIGLRCVLKIFKNLLHQDSIDPLTNDKLTKDLFEQFLILEA